MDGHFDNFGDWLKGVLIGVDKIVLDCIVVTEDVFRVCLLIELDGKGLGVCSIAVTKDSVFLSDDVHVNSMVSVNSDINNL
jgi:hypothetical protein